MDPDLKNKLAKMDDDLQSLETKFKKFEQTKKQ